MPYSLRIKVVQPQGVDHLNVGENQDVRHPGMRNKSDHQIHPDGNHGQPVEKG